MEGLFIAPPGAMQFEFLHSRSKGAQILVGTVIWVFGDPTTNCADRMCSCRPKYRIVIESLPESLQPLIRRLAAERGHPSVCACNGRIIE